MPIRIDIDYPVFTIIIDNPEVKNAVDGSKLIENNALLCELPLMESYKIPKRIKQKL